MSLQCVPPTEVQKTAPNPDVVLEGLVLHIRGDHLSARRSRRLVELIQILQSYTLAPPALVLVRLVWARMGLEVAHEIWLATVLLHPRANRASEVIRVECCELARAGLSVPRGRRCTDTFGRRRRERGCRR